jgi:hypothetical protein
VGTETPIPAATFAAPVGELDEAAFAAFVGALRAETADDVTVEPPRITVRTGDDRTDLRVVPAGADPDGTEAVDGDVDAVVTAAEGASGPHVLGPADLRQRLLYGLDADAADALCERFLDAPARSERDAADAVGTASPATTDATGTADDDAPNAVEPHVDAGDAGARPDDSDDGSRGGDGAGTTVTAAGWDAPAPRVVAAAALALIVVIAVAVGGALPAGDLLGDGAASAGVDDGEAGTAGNGTDGESVATTTATATAGDPVGITRTVGIDGTRERNVAPEPTCTRSPLLVVQIQMNALKHNDNATNDGIRTVRRFASPRNRRVVGSFERLVSTVRSPTFAPMLTYESVRYAPGTVDERSALVNVTTYADGNATGRYAFFLSKQAGSTYDGCWMTDGVQALPVEGAD